MEMEIGFILAQICSIISWSLFLLSYHREDITKLLRIQICASIFDIVSYALLGGDAGILVSIAELVKGFLYYKTDKDKLIFVCFLPIYAIFAYFSVGQEGLIALIPIIASVIDSLMLTFNRRTAVIGGVISTLLWVVYDFLVMAYSAAFTDSLLIVSNLSILVLGYSHIMHINRLHIEQCKYLTKNISLNISQLDRKNFAKKYLWTDEQQKRTFEQDQQSLLLIRNRKKTIGYINFFAITEEEFEHLKRARVFYQEIAPSEIIGLRKRRKNYILIESINIDLSYDAKSMHELISHRLRIFFRNKRKQGYNLHGVLFVPINEFEQEFAEHLNFTPVRTYRDGEVLHEFDQAKIADFLA